MTASPVYQASPIKRARATKAEMEERAEFLIGYASEHGPVTVRGLYYQAEVARLPGISKDDKDYDKVQRQIVPPRTTVVGYLRTQGAHPACAAPCLID